MNRRLRLEKRSWQLKEPFVIARSTQTAVHVAVAHLEEDGSIGRGEAVGVSYHGETPDTMLEQIEGVRSEIEAGVGRRELLTLLPAGGARNAIDAALWDLEAKQTDVSVWDMAGLAPARPVTTAVTIGIREIEAYEARARALSDHHLWLKIKVSADRPLEALAAVRRGAPQARLIVDPNQAWSVAQLNKWTSHLLDLRIDLLEQPVPAAEDEELETLDCPLPLCADEAADTAADLPRLVGRYDFVNIKLDKAGGLTAALDFAHAARDAGLRLMVGCMAGGSLAMAPAMVLAQLCEVADLDGPLLQAEDWPSAITFSKGTMSLPQRALGG
jgi:L-Ala-D/L-Glu epimerase